MKSIDQLIQNVKDDPENKEFTEKGWEPILRVTPKVRILIVGQAPGIKTQLERNVFKDQSGNRLRAWMGIDDAMFYDSGLIGVLPLDFYFPGKAKTGDLPPRKGFAQKWHPEFLKLMPECELIILAGSYAQKEYLKKDMKRNLTETIREYEIYLPKYFPLVHPSPLNGRWLAKNSWFEKEVIPKLQERVHDILFKTV